LKSKLDMKAAEWACCPESLVRLQDEVVEQLSEVQSPALAKYVERESVTTFWLFAWLWRIYVDAGDNVRLKLAAAKTIVQLWSDPLLAPIGSERVDQDSVRIVEFLPRILPLVREAKCDVLQGMITHMFLADDKGLCVQLSEATNAEIGDELLRTPNDCLAVEYCRELGRKILRPITSI